MNSAITVTGHAKVYPSTGRKSYEQEGGTAHYYPLEADGNLIVRVLGGYVGVANNLPVRVEVEETTPDGDTLEDVLDPRQSREYKVRGTVVSLSR